MGASVGPYWPGIEEELTEEQLESQPGFFNDCKGWGNWMADRLMEPRTLEAIRNLKADAILSSTTNGVEDEDVDWVTPQELRQAAQKLGEAIRASSEIIHLPSMPIAWMCPTTRTTRISTISSSIEAEVV